MSELDMWKNRNEERAVSNSLDFIEGILQRGDAYTDYERLLYPKARKMILSWLQVHHTEIIHDIMSKAQDGPGMFSKGFHARLARLAQDIENNQPDSKTSYDVFNGFMEFLLRQKMFLVLDVFSQAENDIPKRLEQEFLEYYWQKRPTALKKAFRETIYKAHRSGRTFQGRRIFYGTLDRHKGLPPRYWFEDIPQKDSQRILVPLSSNDMEQINLRLVRGKAYSKTGMELLAYSFQVWDFMQKKYREPMEISVDDLTKCYAMKDRVIALANLENGFPEIEDQSLLRDASRLRGRIRDTTKKICQKGDQQMISSLYLYLMQCTGKDKTNLAIKGECVDTDTMESAAQKIKNILIEIKKSKEFKTILPDESAVMGMIAYEIEKNCSHDALL